MLLLASWLTSGSINSQELVPGQIYNTQNLTNSSTSASSTTGTWQNVGLWNQGLPCWQPGGPTYCGPKPYFNNGSVNFSYGATDLNQVVNIAAALPAGSTGLRVNGFNFGFTAKNGNGWDNGQQDYLAAYVKFRDASSAVVANYDYSGTTNKQYNWTTFNFSETFATPYAASSLSTAQYGFVGKDTNGWAGPYGPEIHSINFSLKYSVDPCVKDPLSSPTCSGFLEALNKTTGATATSATTTTTAAPAAVVTTTTETPVTTTATTVSGPPPAAVSADLLSKIVESNRTANAASVASITAATNLNDKSSVTAFALSVIAKNAANDRANQEKAVGDALASANAAAAAAVEQSQAIASAQSLAGTNSANRLAGAAVATSAPAPGVNTAASVPAAGANNAVAGPAQANNTDNANQSNLLATPATIANDTATQFTTSAVQSTVTQNNNPLPTSTAVASGFELLPPAPATQSAALNPAQGLNVAITSTPFTPAPVFVSPAPVTELPKFNEADSNRNIDMSSPTDFIAGYVNTKHNLNDQQATTNAPAVNSKAQDNDAAGGVTIAAIAKMPPGYDLYTSLSIRDATFYKPEELYRGQKTVDNVRLLRGLTGASDRVHQEMVDSQYNK